MITRFFHRVYKDGLFLHSPYFSYRWPENFYEKLQEFWFVKKSVPLSKLRYLRVRYKHGAHKVALCYPEKPRPFHMLYLLLHNLGYAITSNPQVPYDVAFSFEDTTFRRPVPLLDELCKKTRVINAECSDISKERVETVFSEVFGYGSFIDPLTYPDKYVRKSNLNAMHDGKIMQGPTIPEPGFVYQTLIESNGGPGVCNHMRLSIVGGTIPVVLNWYHYERSQFNRVDKTEWVETDDALSKEEQEKILLFCNKFGLTFGELDVLRHKDGRIFIIDANNTPAGSVPSIHIPRSELARFLSTLSQAMSKELFAPPAS